MKHGKNLTRQQRKLVQSRGLNPDNWLVVKNLPDKLVLVHREKKTIIEVEVRDGREIC